MTKPKEPGTDALASGETALASGETAPASGLDAVESGRTLAQGSDAAAAAPIIRPGRLAGAPSGEDDIAPGTKIGHYVVLARIGRGGMGTVYRAEDTMLGRQVALKRLHASASADSRARLVREARTAAQLQHPNVLTVHEVSEHDGTPFLAMELVDGVTLTEWLKSTTRAWRDIVGMLVQAGRGLIAAHERGLVHRDFKPDNVLVDRSGRVRVADFGLARAVEDRDGDLVGVGAIRDDRLARLTATGALAGTPAYMAPELVAGEPPDARSDQYAFALTLHEALHGRHPFVGTTVDTLWAEMAAERIRPGLGTVPASLERAVRRGLAADPAKRWPDMTALVDAITPQVGIRRRWLAIGAAVVLAVTGGTAVMVLGGKPQQQPCDQVVRAYRVNFPRDTLVKSVQDPADLARVDAMIAAFEREAKAQLVDSCLDTRAGRQSVQLAEKRAACIDRSRSRLWSVLDRISARASGGAALATMLDDQPNLLRCTDVEWLSRPTPPPLNAADQQALTRAEGALERAASLRDAGDLVGAEKELDTVIDTAGRLEDHVLATRAWLLRIELDRDRGDVASAQANATQAAAAAGLSADRDLALRTQLVMLTAAAANNPKTVDSFTSLVDMPDTADTATLRIAYADALMAAGRMKEGEAEYRRALATREKLLPPAHVDRALALQRVGAALVIQKRQTEARPILEQATATIAKVMSPLRREAIDGLRYLAMVEEDDGNLGRALELYREVLARRTKVHGDKHPMVLDARQAVARNLADTGNYAEAVTELEAVVEGMLAAMGDRSMNAADARVSLANALISLGRFAEADAALAAAMPLLVRGKGPDSPYTLVAEFAQARSWLERPKPIQLAEATRYLDRAEPVFVKLFGASSQPAAAVAITRARALLAKREAKGADELAVRAITMLGDDKRGERAEALSMHAAILWTLGHRDAARATAERAIADFSAAGPGHAPRVVLIRSWLRAPSGRPPLPPTAR